MSELFLRPRALGELGGGSGAVAAAAAAAAALGGSSSMSLESPDSAPPTMLPLGAGWASSAESGRSHWPSPAPKVVEVSFSLS